MQSSGVLVSILVIIRACAYTCACAYATASSRVHVLQLLYTHLNRLPQSGAK